MYTVDPQNEAAVRQAVQNVLAIKNMSSSYLPHEFTLVGMMERVGLYVLHQDFCDGVNLAINKKGGNTRILFLWE